MIRGIGVDLVDVARFEAALARTPSMGERLLTHAERALPAASQAARFAAKEALVKALGGPSGLSWQDVEVTSGGAPTFILTGATAALVGTARVHLSISHDGGVAAAYVVLEDLERN